MKLPGEEAPGSSDDQGDSDDREGPRLGAGVSGVPALLWRLSSAVSVIKGCRAGMALGSARSSFISGPRQAPGQNPRGVFAHRPGVFLVSSFYLLGACCGGALFLLCSPVPCETAVGHQGPLSRGRVSLGPQAWEAVCPVGGAAAWPLGLQAEAPPGQGGQSVGSPRNPSSQVVSGLLLALLPHGRSCSARSVSTGVTGGAGLRAMRPRAAFLGHL